MSRGGKSKNAYLPGDLVALGSKGSRTEPNTQEKRGSNILLHRKLMESTLTADRKRSGPPLAVPIPNKKPKSHANASHSSFSWEQMCIDVDSIDLIDSLNYAFQNQENLKAVGLLFGAFKTMHTQRLKPDLFWSLLIASRQYSTLFQHEEVINALCSILTPHTVASTKLRHYNIVAAVIAANLLLTSHDRLITWPESFVKVFVEDSMGERLWVDNEECRYFVDNIKISFNTRPSPFIPLDFLDSTTPEVIVPIPDSSEVSIEPRYTANQSAVENLVLDVAKEYLIRRQSSEGISKNLLKLLSAAAGILEIRVMVAGKLEVWLQNAKLVRPAQELLLAVCVNCTSHTQRDFDVISTVVKMRLKTKSMGNFYVSCIKEMISANASNLPVVLKNVVYNEMSASRNTSNMAIFQVIFKAEPEQSALLLADIFQELLILRDDYLRPLRGLLREISRQVRADFNFLTFCQGLMSAKESLNQTSEVKDRVFAGIIDLLTLCIFLTVYPYMRSERKDVSQFEKMQHVISKIQKDGVVWLQESVLKMYRPSPTDFVHALHKILLMEPSEQYYKLESWPPEQDRSTMFRIATEVPLLQGTIMTILMIGLSKEHPLNSPDALELVDQLVKRAASLQVYQNLMNTIRADKCELFEILLDSCAYHHPDKIELPLGYTPPQLAISNLYWKTWLIMLIYCAHIPSVFGTLACRKYPMLRIFIEMCITNNFTFPTFLEDIQLQSIEKQKILEFESYLAAASTKITITEQTSLLLSQLMGMDPVGPPRRPPSSILEQLRVMNTNLRIGHLLCRSRDPDFLLDIIQRQGTSQSMPWLADLVNSSEGSLNHLPVQCLCEFLLSPSCRQQGKFNQLLNHLRKLLMHPETDPTISCEVLEYFLRRLSSPTSRQHAILGLKLLLNAADDKLVDVDKVIESKSDVSWLLTSLPQLPNFPVFKSQIVIALRQACQVENDPHLITAYLTFLAEQTSDANKVDGLTNEQLTDMVLDMAQLIVERSTVMAAVLPISTDTVTIFNSALNSLVNIFYTFLCRAREPCRQNHPWSENQDQILVTWPGGQECTLHILVVHAMIILLTYGPQCIQDPMKFDHLLEAWFPINRKQMPKAYLVDTSEEALLIPDWLKLRMIRSRVPRLVEEALTDLEPPQLILFIQSFGIPVASMSKLLEILDQAVCHNSEAIKAAVMDKAYMVQLVQVQQRRGAQGGQIFSSVLTLNDESIAMDEDNAKSTNKIKSLMKENTIAKTEKHKKLNIDLTLKNLFISKMEGEEFLLLLKSLSQDIKSVAQQFMIAMLKKMLKSREFLYSVIGNENVTCQLLKVLMAKYGFNKILLSIVKLMAPLIDGTKNKNNLNIIITSYINKYVEPKIKKSQKIKKEFKSEYIKIDVNKGKKQSLFVDLPKEIELKILDLTIDQQVCMLFSNTTSEKWESIRNCRPYLLTLLNHHMNWSSLECVLDILLELDNVEKFEPSSVLDLITAITTNPKLWQGREMNASKSRSSEGLMILNNNQLTALLLYMIKECRVKQDDPSITQIELSAFMQTKLSVIMKNCLVKNNCMEIFHNIYLKYINNSNITVFKQILSLVYTNDPNIISKLQFYDMDGFLDPIIIKESEGCALDSISHTIVSSIVSTKIKRDKELNKRIYDYEILAKRLCTTHPLLFLRVFELLSAPLRRCCYLEFKAMKSGHLLLLNNILDLIESLEPTVYLPFYTDALHRLLGIFLTIISNNLNNVNSSRKEFNTLLTKFGNRLHSYIAANSQDAMIFIKSNILWFGNIVERFKTIGNLNLLICQNDQVIILQSPNETSNDPPYDNFFSCFKDTDTANNLLSDMERSAYRSNRALVPFLNKVASLIRNPNSHLRIPSLGLLLHYLQFNNSSLSTNSVLVPAILSALLSDEDEVSSTIRNHIDSLSMSREMALSLLLETFRVGIYKSLNTTPLITKTISTMNLQSGC